MGHAIEHQVLINLIADDVDVAVRNQRSQRVQLGAADQGAARVVRAVEDDHSGAGRQCLFELLPIDRKIIQPQLHVNTTPPASSTDGS